VTNKQGFRNEQDFTYEKPAGTIRVISLGDSHTQGYEVYQDETFSAVIERFLQTRGFQTEVMNAGVSGFSTAEALAFLENEGIKYNPDVIVLGFYANDFQDNLKADLFKLEPDGQLIINKKEHIPGVKIQNIIYSIPCVKWLSENSYFYSLLFNNIWTYYKLRMEKRAAERAVEYAVPTKESFTDYETELMAALIKRLYHVCQEHQAKLIILDIPYRIPGKSEIKSSFTDSILPTIVEYSDAFIQSDSLLTDFVGTAEIIRPHGHEHISDFTHLLLGVSTGKEIVTMLNRAQSQENSE
jgi:lysophospholipase L1-like esterase